MTKENAATEMEKFRRRVEFLESSERRKEVPPEKILGMLPVKKSDNFLDLGAGTGYFSIPAAKLVEGQVFALDIEPKMLEMIESKVMKENITNVKTLKASIDDIPLSDHSIDFVIVSLVLHEIKHLLSSSLQEVKRVLKPNGYFACIEFEKQENPTHNHPRISSSTMEQVITKTGLKVTEKLYPGEGIYIIIAKNEE